MKDPFSDAIAEGSVWRHTESGDLYKIICVTNLMATNTNFVQQVVYECENHNVWSRPLSEWESKFSFIKPA